LIYWQISDESPWQQVLREHRVRIIQAADLHDTLLNALLDHLFSKKCIQQDQRELIKKKEISRDRMSTLLDILSSEGQSAFNEFCTALENFGTEEKKLLASTLRKSFTKKIKVKSEEDAG
jgi:RNA-splicing ligase RtcB